MSYFDLYRFATRWDLGLIGVGVVFSILKACALPLLIISYSEFTTLLLERTAGFEVNTTTAFLHWFDGGAQLRTNATIEERNDAIRADSRAYGIFVALVTLIHFISGIVCVDCFNRAALQQITNIRIRYFQSLIRQDVAWYDVAGDSNNFAVRITQDIEKIRDGIAEKVTQYLNSIIGALICVIISFSYGWQLSLVVISYIPLVIISVMVVGKFRVKLIAKEGNAYSAAANVAEEVLSGIRTVFAFGGEQLEIERYNKQLTKERRAVLMKGVISGIGDGIMRFLFFGSNALGFWYGVKLVLEDRDRIDKQYTPEILMITFIGLLIAAENISRTGPFIEAFSSARGSAESIFNVIDRKSKIDAMSSDGVTLKAGVKRSILFKNVFFSYPSRPDVPILRGLNLEIQPGQSVALVGGSGNGKSTCLQLLQRFYDPNEGQVLIDGHDIRKLNINKLRSNIATVGQEPILFSTTIGENIRYGRPDASDADVVSAAKMTGAHDFIEKFPLGYNTLVGAKGSQLSGGQKQRIAIARAMIQNPKILLLDEATSALDYQSEKLVQATLDKVSQGRTTLTVSHRLSAIRNADRIVFLDKGVVVEDGTHTELMAKKGRYYEMISAGGGEDENEDANVEELALRREIRDEVAHEARFSNNFIENPIYMNIRNRSSQQNSLRTSLRNSSALTHISPFFNHQTNTENYFRRASVSSMDQIAEGKSNDDIQYGKVYKRIITLLRPQRWTMILAIICACLVGATIPAFAVIFGNVYGTLASNDKESALSETSKNSGIFVGIGVIAFLAVLLQTFLFSRVSFDLATRVRLMTFSALMRQECSWFDDKNHSPAALSARLTNDADTLQAVIGDPLGVVFQSLATFLTGIIVSFVFSWKLSLVCLVVLPLTIVTVLLDAKNTSKAALAEKEAVEVGTKIATEAIMNIRTVASLRQETAMIERYVAEITKAAAMIRKKIVWRGLVNSTAQSIPFLGYAIAFTYGGFLIADGEMPYQDVIKVSQALLEGTIVLGEMFIFAPAFTAAFVGMHRIIQIIDRVPMINSPVVNNKSRKPDKSNNIDFKNIDFRYPTRPDVQILNNFNLNVMEGKTIALVGPSGCGKSTCIQLLQRFYDPEHGRIHVGLDEITTDVSLEGLRSKLGIVSQEPVLFDKTIAENIAYGDNSRVVPMEEIMDAARIANVHDFIVQLPLGYETTVGLTSQFSGGQKQRIAIARAMVRNPKILLLDEATSALDLHSEQVVQQALDSARSGRTCLVIAHRLSTVQNADAICVVRGGNIVEYGTHNELLALDGIYTRLYNSQK